MIELCTVKKIKKRVVYIEISRNENCESCKVCAFNRRERMTVPAVSDVDVSLGDTVAVEMPTQSVGVGSLLVYAFPVLFMLVGALIGLVGGLWLEVGLCAAGLVLGTLCAWLTDRAYRRRSGVLPRILRVSDPDGIEKSKSNDSVENTVAQ